MIPSPLPPSFTARWCYTPSSLCLHWQIGRVGMQFHKSAAELLCLMNCWMCLLSLRAQIHCRVSLSLLDLSCYIEVKHFITWVLFLHSWLHYVISGFSFAYLSLKGTPSKWKHICITLIFQSESRIKSAVGGSVIHVGFLCWKNPNKYDSLF